MSYDLQSAVFGSSDTSMASSYEDSLQEQTPTEGPATFAFGLASNYKNTVGQFYFATDTRSLFINGNEYVPKGKGQIYTVVETLPTENIKLDQIYLCKPSTDATYYIEYLYVNSKWEVIGMSSEGITSDSDGEYTLSLNF